MWPSGYAPLWLEALLPVSVCRRLLFGAAPVWRPPCRPALSSLPPSSLPIGAVSLVTPVPALPSERSSVPRSALVAEYCSVFVVSVTRCSCVLMALCNPLTTRAPAPPHRSVATAWLRTHIVRAFGVGDKRPAATAPPEALQPTPRRRRQASPPHTRPDVDMLAAPEPSLVAGDAEASPSPTPGANPAGLA